MGREMGGVEYEWLRDGADWRVDIIHGIYFDVIFCRGCD